MPWTEAQSIAVVQERTAMRAHWWTLTHIVTEADFRDSRSAEFACGCAHVAGTSAWHRCIMPRHHEADTPKWQVHLCHCGFGWSAPPR